MHEKGGIFSFLHEFSHNTQSWHVVNFVLLRSEG